MYTLVVMSIILIVGSYMVASYNTENVQRTITPTTPTVVVTPIVEVQQDPEIIVHVKILKSGQSEIVEGKAVSIFGDGNSIGIANKDVERILVTGDGNVVLYSKHADPIIQDLGNYNSIEKAWLT